MDIMSYEEYVKLGNHKRPYVVRIDSGGKSLFYFGEQHSFDPAHEQWKVLKNLWEEFMQLTSGRSRIVFVEGGTRPIATSEIEAISKHGGMGLLSFLANKEGIEIYSPEPSEEEERANLEKNFSRDEIQYYYFARVVGQWGRILTPRPDFREYMESFLSDDDKNSGWKDYDFSMNAMKELHQKFFDQGFNPEDYKFFDEICRPTELKTRINEVSRASGDIRDRFIIKQIQRCWNDGKSIFASYGSSHVVRQEALLRDLLQN